MTSLPPCLMYRSVAMPAFLEPFGRPQRPEVAHFLHPTNRLVSAHGAIRGSTAEADKILRKNQEPACSRALSVASPVISR